MTNMISDIGKYYLYRHIRMDTNKPFYVGMSTKVEVSRGTKKMYVRAYSKGSRNAYWKEITKSSPYEVEIIMESDDREFLGNKEKEFIKLYGRADLNEGTLCNLTDGSDECLNKSRDAINRQLETSKRNGTYEQACERMREASKKTNRNGEFSRVRKDVYIYANDGSFLKHCYTIKEAAIYVFGEYQSVSKWIDGMYLYKKNYYFSTYQGDKLSYNVLSTGKKRVGANYRKKKISLIELTSGQVFNFNSREDASMFLGYCRSYLSNAMFTGQTIFKNYKVLNI